MSERALVKNGANQEQLAFAKRREKRQADARTSLVAAQLSTVAGREFVWSLFEGLDDYPLGAASAEEANFWMGQRRKLSQLREEIRRYHLDAFLLMQREAYARATRIDVEIEKAQTTNETDAG